MANYTDKPLDFNQQVALLKSNGLAFADEQKALHTLQHVSYFSESLEYQHLQCEIEKPFFRICNMEDENKSICDAEGYGNDLIKSIRGGLRVAFCWLLCGVAGGWRGERLAWYDSPTTPAV